MKLLTIDSFNLFSNPGFGASVLLGTAGSIYLIIQSVKLVSNRTSKRSISIGNKLCVICNAELKNSNEELNRCNDCNNVVCENQKCSEYNLELQTRKCINCKKNREIQQKTGEFFLKHLNELEDRSLAVIVESIINKWNDGQEVAIVITRSQLNTVSKFVEVILEKKIESALAIERSCDQQHSSQPAANTTTSNDYYTDLKRFITHICEEVMKISNALDIAGIPPRLERQQNDEQILSTVQPELEQNIDISMAISDKVELRSAPACKVDDNQNHIFHLNASKEELLQSECEKCKERESTSMPTELENVNFNDDIDMQHLNDCIQRHSAIALPDLSSDSDFLIDNLDEFETPNDNWQLREILKSNKNGVITMLIPSMAQEMRAQIGDRSADEYDSDLSENEIEYDEAETGDEDFPQNMCYSTTVHIMTKTPLASIKTVPIDIDSNESFTSMIDIEPLSLEEESKNDKTDREIFLTDISPPNVVNFDNVEDEKLFDSIVEISSINDHKKSIDEAFESILKADCSEILKKEEEIAQRVHKTLENLLKEEEEAAKKIHEAVNAAPLRDKRTFLPVENVHEAINGTNESITYRKIELDDNNRTRYSSPLFQSYNLAPIKSFKVVENHAPIPKSAPVTSSVFDPFPSNVIDTSTNSQFQLPIPNDNSISNLLHTSSLISRSQVDLNNTVDDENLKDPEKVLTNTLVPGSFSEREHFKWLHAAPIANNPYSPDILERRLSETQNKSKVIDIHTLMHPPEQPIHENKNEDDEPKPQRPNIIKYKRDYYINDDEAKHQHKNHSQTTHKSITSPTKHAIPTHFNESNEELIKPKKKTYDEITVSMLIEDVEAPVKYTRHDQDFSLTMSEDSDYVTTRIYTPSTQQVSTFKGPISIDGSEVAILVKSKSDNEIKDEISFEEAFEEKQVIEKDVLEQLPSVRKLAELYKQQDTLEDNTLTNKHVKPLVEKNATKDLHQNYLAPIASITARTLPAQVRANLKQSFENEDSESFARYDDREPSPDIQPGFTKSSIAFFEKLGN